MKTIICRTGFCPVCEASHRPHKGSLFLAYGSHRGAYYVREAMKDGIQGFVPHLFILNKVTEDHICVVSTVCCCYDCGVERTTRNGQNFYSVKEDAWKTVFMTVPDWNALTMYKRIEQYQV